MDVSVVPRAPDQGSLNLPGIELRQTCMLLHLVRLNPRVLLGALDSVATPTERHTLFRVGAKSSLSLQQLNHEFRPRVDAHTPKDCFQVGVNRVRVFAGDVRQIGSTSSTGRIAVFLPNLESALVLSRASPRQTVSPLRRRPVSQARVSASTAHDQRERK